MSVTKHRFTCLSVAAIMLAACASTTETAQQLQPETLANAAPTEQVVEDIATPEFNQYVVTYRARTQKDAFELATLLAADMTTDLSADWFVIGSRSDAEEMIYAKGKPDETALPTSAMTGQTLDYISRLEFGIGRGEAPASETAYLAADVQAMHAAELAPTEILEPDTDPELGTIEAN